MEYYFLGDGEIPCAPGGGPCEGPQPAPGEHCFTVEQLQALATPGCRNYFNPVPGNACNFSTVCVTPAEAQSEFAVYGGRFPMIGPAVVAPPPAPNPVTIFQELGVPDPRTVTTSRPNVVAAPIAPLTARPNVVADSLTWAEDVSFAGIPNWIWIAGVAGLFFLRSQR